MAFEYSIKGKEYVWDTLGQWEHYWRPHIQTLNAPHISQKYTNRDHRVSDERSEACQGAWGRREETRALEKIQGPQGQRGNVWWCLVRSVEIWGLLEILNIMLDWVKLEISIPTAWHEIKVQPTSYNGTHSRNCLISFQLFIRYLDICPL